MATLIIGNIEFIENEANVINIYSIIEVDNEEKAEELGENNTRNNHRDYVVPSLFKKSGGEINYLMESIKEINMLADYRKKTGEEV